MKICHFDVAIAIEDKVRLSTSNTGATATFSGDPKAVIQTHWGPAHGRYTPAGVEVTGNVTLDDLRRVFPGY